MIVPLRAPPLFAATVNVTDPLPLPDAALAVEIHGAFATAVHAQPLPAVIAIVPVPPAAATDWLAGEIAKLHGAAACVTVNDLLATIIVALRAGPVFAATVNVTDPLPVADAPLVIEIHDEFSVAAHAQLTPAVTVTATVSVPPLAPTDTLVGEIENAHDAAACVIVAVLPFTDTVAVRDPPVFAAALTVTAPFPVPEFAPEIVSHAALVVARHSHAAPVVIVTVAEPPLAAMLCAFGDSANVHGGGGCGPGGGAGGSGGGPGEVGGAGPGDAGGGPGDAPGGGAAP